MCRSLLLFPAGPAASHSPEQLENMFGHVWLNAATCCRKDFAITPPHSVEPGCAKVLGFGSVVAAQPLGCLQTGTVGWTGKVKGGWGMGNHLKFMLHTAENPSWKAAVWT